MSEYEKKDFARRGYYVEHDDFGKKPIEIVVKVGGQQLAQLVLGEPGICAVVSKQDEAGIWIELVRPDGMRFMDIQAPSNYSEQLLLDWQAKALGM